GGIFICNLFIVLRKFCTFVPIIENKIVMVRNIFRGLGIALITPFRQDGSVDYDALLRLVEYQLSNGADF
ncbi:dihydrodipicolinate synthase family protein, partial [Klebsiella pneumoniae]|nr:dihydrodipicolinate synthase family protein [Klebsiella pneumoniae]